MLVLPAAILSLPLAWLTLRGASRVPGIPEAAPAVSFSGAAALVAIGIAVVTALAAGLIPLRGLFRTEPVNALQADGARHTTVKGVARFRASLATMQSKECSQRPTGNERIPALERPPSRAVGNG